MSELIILDSAGRTLSSKPLFDGFVADWRPREGIVAFRDWSYALIGEDGAIRQQGRVCPEQAQFASPRDRACTERVAYLSTVASFLWVHQIFGASTLLTPGGQFSAYHRDKYLGEWLVPSPDERFVAVGPGRLGRMLNIYSVRERSWLDLGEIVIHPDRGWEWMEPSWSPWFRNSSQLVFFTKEGLVVSSPDGFKKRVVYRTQEPAGLAVRFTGWPGDRICDLHRAAASVRTGDPSVLDLYRYLGRRSGRPQPAAKANGIHLERDIRLALARRAPSGA